MSPSKREPLPEACRLPHPDRYGPGRPGYSEILRLHTEAMAVGRPQYRDPATGYEVFTAQFLWDQGFCCKAACRHCPYVERPG